MVILHATLHASAGACLTVALAVIATAWPEALRGQQTVLTTTEIACGSCRIETGARIVLRGSFDNGSLEGSPTAIRRAPDGRFFVVAGVRDRIDVYAPNGQVTGHSIGRRGRGPGEYDYITNFLVRDRVLHIYDGDLRRRTDIDLRTLQVIRTVEPLPHHIRFAVFGDGRSVISGSVRTREAAGQPLHVHRADGTREGSFGVREPFLRPDLESLLYYAGIHAASDSTFWAVPQNELRIELWHVEGRLLRMLRGGRPWFEPWNVRGNRSFDSPPQPNVADLLVDSDGLLWVLSSIAGDRWRDALRPAPAGGPHAGEPIVSMRSSDPPYKVVMLEVIDPSTGRRLAERRFPYFHAGFAGPGYLWRAWIDEFDLPRAEIIPFSMVGR